MTKNLRKRGILRCAASLAACLALHALPVNAKTVKPPKQMCVLWVNSVDDQDTWEMNWIVRAVPGKITARFADQTPAVLRFYGLEGMASVGDLPGGVFPALQGSAWMYSNGTDLFLSLAAAGDAGPILFRGSYTIGTSTGGLARVGPDGTATAGAFSVRSCADVVIND